MSVRTSSSTGWSRPRERPRITTTRTIRSGSDGEPPAAARVRALEDLLVEKGVLTHEEVRARIDWLVSRTPAHGARLVARAWVDPAFKQRALDDARLAALELGLDPGESPQVVALENTDDVHHMVVCTLCSCYPKALLGPPPDWYKSLPYRSRAVSDPRGVLEEFGLDLDEQVEVRVVDSTADVRYVVIPQRPAGTEHLDEEALAAIVTRDSMIGVATPVRRLSAAYAGRSTTSIAVPRPGFERSVSAPSIASARERMFATPCPSMTAVSSNPTPSSDTVTTRRPARCEIDTSTWLAPAWRRALPSPSWTILNTSICSSGASRTCGSTSSSTSSAPSAVRTST